MNYQAAPDNCTVTIQTERGGEGSRRNRYTLPYPFPKREGTGKVDKKAVGSDLYEQVFYSLDLIEKDYFGLQYTDPNNVQKQYSTYVALLHIVVNDVLVLMVVILSICDFKHWLDPTKAIKKQVK
ncbi:unnamed protein product, partial [Timema podura]|nr:unnamed protein product [Timema podura]